MTMVLGLATIIALVVWALVGDSACEVDSSSVQANEETATTDYSQYKKAA